MHRSWVGRVGPEPSFCLSVCCRSPGSLRKARSKVYPWRSKGWRHYYLAPHSQKRIRGQLGRSAREAARSTDIQWFLGSDGSQGCVWRCVHHVLGQQVCQQSLPLEFPGGQTFELPRSQPCWGETNVRVSKEPVHEDFVHILHALQLIRDHTSREVHGFSRSKKASRWEPHLGSTCITWYLRCQGGLLNGGF